MDNNFFVYLKQLELMAFFSGYPLLYTIVFFITEKKRSKNNLGKRILSSLPFAYALVGTLYLGLQLKNLYPNYSVENIKHTIEQPWLVIWALLSVFFWLRGLSKKKFLSLIHSLVFFFFLLKDLLAQLFISSADKSKIINDMNVYTSSILLNIICFVIILLLSFLFIPYKNSLRS